MIKVTTNKQCYEAIADMASTGFFFLDEGESIYCIRWDSRVAVISHSKNPDTKEQTITLHAKGALIWNLKKSQPVFELRRKDIRITAYDDKNGLPAFSFPVIDFECKSDFLQRSSKK